MIIPGRVALARKIITNIRSAEHQTQPCGIDLTLKGIMKWSTSGTIDFDNKYREPAQATNIPFESSTQFVDNSDEPVRSPNGDQRIQDSNDRLRGEYINLSCGPYLIEFNELVEMPLDLMGQILVRSSLFRSGALISAGVMDSGYKGAIGALLQVINPNGLRLLRNAKLAQMVFHQMTEPVEGYSGTYQGRTHV